MRLFKSPIPLSALLTLGFLPFGDSHGEGFQTNDLRKRATPQAPDGYAPAHVQCPNPRPQIRSSRQSPLSPAEKEWTPRRRTQTIEPMKTLLERIAIPDFDVDSYFKNADSDSDALPTIGIAISGGGYRAMLNGAGAIAAFDSRSSGSSAKGNLGGLLQSATYLSGLSGGGWLVGSIYANNFTSVQDAVNSGKIWQFGENLLEGPKDVETFDYYDAIFNETDAKHDAGFNRSITDYWGRMLSFQLIDAKNGGPAYTFSSIAQDPDFSSASAPLPILVADSRGPTAGGNSTINSTLFEFNPWELGSFDPTLQGFVPLKHVGSNFANGKVPDNDKCVEGFDNLGYVMGTSSSLFNQIIVHLKNHDPKYVPKGVPKFVFDILSDILNDLSDAFDDVADWTPNPFKGFNANFDSNDSHRLTLVDGGEDGQNVPLHPHLVTERAVDVVFAVDTSADTSSWPDGTSLQKTYERSLLDISNGTSFPVVPGINTFINLGLNTKPTFFGCDSTNTTVPAPLVVYLPNYPYVFYSNVTTFTMTYNNSMRDAMIENGWDSVTQLNSTRDKEWDVCVGCAVLQRSWERTKTKVPDACERCFSRYCWNGTIDQREPAHLYEPRLYSEEVTISGADSSGRRSMGVGLFSMIMLLGVNVALLS